MLPFAKALACAGALASMVPLGACGSRTALSFSSSGAPGTNDHGDGGDTTTDGDVPSFFDAAGLDGALADAPPADAPTDSTLPTIDAAIAPDAASVTCADGSTDTVYLVSQGRTLYRFDPPSRVAVPLASLECPGATSVPTTMAIADGAAYVMDGDNSLFRVDLSTFACTRTAFVASALAFTGSLGLASASVAGVDSLYVFGCALTLPEVPCVGTLARADLATFALDIDYPTVQPLPLDMQFPVDMKADGLGRLLAIDLPGTLVQVDPTSASVLGADETGFGVSSAEALLLWSGALYLFGGTRGQIDVYDLATRKLSSLGQVGDAIVGAGTAPCQH